MENMDKNIEEHYQAYLAERKSLIDAERDTAQQFDKAILTLAAGALALSITFIQKIAPQPKPSSVCFLILAWSLFSLSILSTLISFLTSQVACRQARERLDQELTGMEVNKEHTAHIWTNLLNYFSIASFILGVVFLVVFSSINLYKGDNCMSEKKKIEEGYVPPKPPVKPVDDIVDDIGKRGFVPQKPPVKPQPPQKPKDKK